MFLNLGAMIIRDLKEELLLISFFYGMINLKKIIMRITNSSFFTVSAIELAQKLLGKTLVRKINDRIIKVKIVETEAYIGKIDRACHAHQENRSK